MVALALVVLVTISIAQVYRALPLVELKRRARHGDKSAKSLYRVSAYQFSSQFLLWFLASVASAGFFVIVARRSPVWVSLVSFLVLIWVAFIWIPRSSINSISRVIAQGLAGPISWLLRYIDPPIHRIGHMLVLTRGTRHTQVYEKVDLENLLKQQSKQTDSRVDPTEIEMLKRVLSFNDKKVIDVMTSKSKVTAVELKDNLGPVILTELHKSGQEYFPVYDEKPGDIVGVIDINNIADVSETKKASAAMTKSVSYAQEEEKLTSILNVMIKTHHQLFIVVNNHEEYTGVITAKDILSELVGDSIIDDFDQHESRQAVAKRFDQVEHNLAEETKDSAELIE